LVIFGGVHMCMHAVHLCVVCVAMWTWPLSVGVLVVVCVLYARERTRMGEVVGVVLI